MSLKIYKMDGSPPSRAVLMIAEFLKLKYETEIVNTMTGENRKPEYVAKNPLHTVPLLEDRGFLLADSHAIITYLVSKYGADKRGELYPSDLALRATIDQRLFFDATKLFPSFGSVVRSILLEKTRPNENQIADINEWYGVLETYLQQSRFVACDYLTLADVSIVASISTLEVLVPIDVKYEKLHHWLNTLKNEEWYKKGNAPGLAQFIDIVNTMAPK